MPKVLKLVPEIRDSAALSQSFAKKQGLRYVDAASPGYGRVKSGKSFRFVDEKGKAIKDPKVIQRIKSLVIPPAWRDVWICKHVNGHLQVTGFDVRGRKQYRYHADWSKSRNEDKFRKLKSFGEVLPKIRERIRKDLNKKHMSRDQILAAVVQTMQITSIRVGNDVYSRENGSYGLTTVRNKHVQIKGTHVHFNFKGKSGVQRDLQFSDRRLSRIIRNCQELPGEELFGYRDAEGRAHDIGSKDVNDYLKQISGVEVTAKDFRTWAGTLKALEILSEMEPLAKETQVARKKRELEVIKQVSSHLGNTVAVCRKYYVDPKVFDCDRCGLLTKKAGARLSKAEGLLAQERHLMKLLDAKLPASKTAGTKVTVTKLSA